MQIHNLQGINMQSAKGNNTWMRYLRWWNEKFHLLAFLWHRWKCSLRSILSAKLLALNLHSKKVTLWHSLAGWNLEGCVSPLLQPLAGLARSILLSNTLWGIWVEFMGELHPPLRWCHVASEWGAKSWLAVWCGAPAMLMPGAAGRAVLQLSSAAAQQSNQYHQESNLRRVLGHGSCSDFSQSVSGRLRANDLTEVCLPPEWFCWGRDVVDLGELSFLSWKLHFRPQAPYISQLSEGHCCMPEFCRSAVAFWNCYRFPFVPFSTSQSCCRWAEADQSNSELAHS